jgi:hypothetical protein
VTLVELSVAYQGQSAVVSSAAGIAVSLAPNLRRDRVSFEGVLRRPIRFREAISALHDIVVSDLRHDPKDRTAHDAYRADQKSREDALRRTVTNEARKAIDEAMPQRDDRYIADLDKRYRRLRRTYWDARTDYANFLRRHDRELWRLLVPCDPVITVADDCLFFECFSVDESSYGCLTVDRAAFANDRDVAKGTTNIDYSWALYEHFQSLRSYRETRFVIDPSGFEVHIGERGDYREEKIPVPPSWLRGFMKLQAVMSLPSRRVPISREGLYNVLAFLTRHRARRSPRAVRFELEPGKPVAIVLEPWERRIVMHGTPYEGPRPETIRIWGRDRLVVLARLLPIVDEAEVYLLGTGLPSFWSVRMGEMRLLLGLSGWTTNAWTGTAAIDQLAPPAQPNAALMGDIASAFQAKPAQTFAAIRAKTGAPAPQVAAGLNQLAQFGQVIHDLHAGLFRWRQIMPVSLSAELIGPEDPETAGAKSLVAARKAHLTVDLRRPNGLRLLEGKVGDRPVSLLLDADGRMLRGKCTCSYHYTGCLRRGPCRHLQSLRQATSIGSSADSLEAWFSAVNDTGRAPTF